MQSHSEPIGGVQKLLTLYPSNRIKETVPGREDNAELYPFQYGGRREVRDFVGSLGSWVTRGNFVKQKHGLPPVYECQPPFTRPKFAGQSRSTTTAARKARKQGEL